PPNLRGSGQLEADRRELPRVLSLPPDPPRAVSRDPERQRGELRAHRGLGGRIDGPDGTRADDVDERGERRRPAARALREAAPAGLLPGPLSQPLPEPEPRLRADPPGGADRARLEPGRMRLPLQPRGVGARGVRALLRHRVL